MSKSKSSRDYDKDEKCLCFHGAYLYEAKIIDFRQTDPSDRKSPYQYRVHYKGWKNTWDDWVPEERLRKPTEENKELAANLLKELKNQQREERDQKAAAKKAGSSSAKRKSEATLGSGHRTSEERSSSVQAPARGTKRGRDWEIEKDEQGGAPRPPKRKAKDISQEEVFTSKPSIRIPLPDHLKGMLVDDWENISKSMLLVPLPHAHPVNEILAAYKTAESQVRRPGSAEHDILDEVVQGVREYFDKSLGRILLYRFERQQWLEITNRMNQMAENAAAAADGDESPLPGKTPSDIYGPEHLCRLFVSMPELIAQTNMDAPSVNRLREELHKMTKWLGKHSGQFFAQEYYDPGPEYKAKAKGGAA